MADRIIFDETGPRAPEILAEFGNRSGLSQSADGKRHVFAVNSADDHRVKVVETLTNIDPHWPEHLALEIPG